MGDCEEWHVLDIRIVFGRVGNDVVDVVIAFPPAAGESTEEVGDEDPNDRVCVEVVRDSHVACIVNGEDELVP